MRNDKVVIPKPCNEGWDTMIPNVDGRHCDSCNKTVIDFTSMTLEQIKSHLGKNNGAKICGHFNVTQVELYRPILHRKLIGLNEYIERTISFRFLRAISLFLVSLSMMIVGCQPETTTGDIMDPNSNKNCSHSEQSLTGDTVYVKKDSSAVVVDGEIDLNMHDSIK